MASQSTSERTTGRPETGTKVDPSEQMHSRECLEATAVIIHNISSSFFWRSDTQAHLLDNRVPQPDSPRAAY